MPNEAQIAHWNSDEANHWVVYQTRYDAMLAPFAHRILDGAPIRPESRILDVGCGCGATTVEAARLASAGTATGLDISAPMLETAKLRAIEDGLANVSWLLGDAQTISLPPEAFDAVISRFGMMFFDDPVAAFANLSVGIASGGTVTFVCWRDLFSNDWIRVPGLAIAEHVPLPDLGPPDAAGMFSFADPDRIRSVLGQASLTDVEVEALDQDILLGGGGSLDETIEFLRQGGMAQAILQGSEPAQQERAIAAAREALQPFATAEGVRIGTAAWLVRARRR